MSDYDFQRMQEYSMIDKRFAFAPRKRVPHNGRQVPTESDVSVTHVTINNGPEAGHIDEAEFASLLREYDTDSENSEDREKELQMLRAQASLRPLLSQGATYLVLLAFIAAFVLVVNWYNMKQLAQLKEEYGLDERMPAPEFWWRKSLIYRIYVHSYQDSDGDGIGDLNGVRQRVDHLVYLGVDAVLLCAFYDSPFEHFGYDIRDFKAVGRKYGTISDFEKLVSELHKHGIKVLVEVIPNHSSWRHKWFLESRRGGPDNSYKNYYIWNKGRVLENGTHIPPNNWVSRFGGSAWTFDDERQQFYYHYYHRLMPDLNLRDSNVRTEILEVFRYWLDRGVDALFVSDVHVLYESDDHELDEPETDEDVKPGAYRSVQHMYTENQPDVHDFLGSWRDFIENYSIQSSRRIGLIIDVAGNTIQEAVKYYFTGPDVPISPALSGVGTDCGGRCFHDLIDSWLTHLPEDRDALWMLSSADRHRVASRKGPKYQSALNMLTMLLPGAVMSYYGEEIGMQEIRLDDLGTTEYSIHLKRKEKEALDLMFSSAPMQWTAGIHSGFTSADRPWLPQHASHAFINVETQKVEPSGKSPMQIYQRLSHLRKERSFLSSKIQFLVVHEQVLSFMRYTRDTAPYMIALNLGTETSVDDYTILTGVGRGKVVLYSGSNPTVVEGGLVNLSELNLEPGDAIVVILVVDDELNG